VRIHGAAGSVRGLWSIVEYIDGVLSGQRSHANQQHGSPEEKLQQPFHRFSFALSLDGDTQL